MPRPVRPATPPTTSAPAPSTTARALIGTGCSRRPTAVTPARPTLLAVSAHRSATSTASMRRRPDIPGRAAFRPTKPASMTGPIPSVHTVARPSRPTRLRQDNGGFMTPFVQLAQPRRRCRGYRQLQVRSAVPPVLAAAGCSWRRRPSAAGRRNAYAATRTRAGRPRVPARVASAEPRDRVARQVFRLWTATSTWRSPAGCAVESPAEHAVAAGDRDSGRSRTMSPDV